MTDSDDNRKGKNLLNERTNNPFERVNHSTNFEDYAISSSDEPNFHYERNNYSDEKNDCPNKTNVTQPIIKEPVSNTFNRIILKPHKYETTVTPRISSHFSMEQMDNLFVDSCLSAGNSSADVTPSGTPQSSPYSMRKAMENKKQLLNSADKKNTLSANPKRWFYTGFFNSDVKPGGEKSVATQIPRNPSFKNLCVSNFDINAVGPTSW